MFYQGLQFARGSGSFSEGYESGARPIVFQCVVGPAGLECTWPLVANRIDAVGVRFEDARHAMCVGFLAHIFRAFLSKLPFSIAPVIANLDTKATGTETGDRAEFRGEDT